MKLRLRIRNQTSRVDLEGAEPRLKELKDLIRETLLDAHGLSRDTAFSVSLNGSERLTSDLQTLESCGVVSGDLICVLLEEQSTEPTSSSSSCPSSSSYCTSSSSGHGGTRPPQQWEPMLCGEAEPGHAPLSLERLYQSADASSPSDALMVAAHLLMLEAGFVPQGEAPASAMPAGWRGAGLHRLQYRPPLSGGGEVTAVAVSMEPLLVINATLKASEVQVVRKLCLKTSSYVTDQWPGGNASATFRDLRKLSRVFKDQLVYPLIAATRDALSLPVVSGLEVLPPEVLLQVFRLLDVRSLVRLSAASRHFSAAVDDPALWRHLYLRDFSPGPDRSRDADWKSLYIASFKRRLPSARWLFNPILTGDYGPPPLAPPLVPPLVPGIIGGEYDQRPHLPYLPRPRYDPLGLHMPRPPFPPLGRPGRRDARRGFI